MRTLTYNLVMSALGVLLIVSGLMAYDARLKEINGPISTFSAASLEVSEDMLRGAGQIRELINSSN